MDQNQTQKTMFEDEKVFDMLPFGQKVKILKKTGYVTCAEASVMVGRSPAGGIKQGKYFAKFIAPKIIYTPKGSPRYFFHKADLFRIPKPDPKFVRAGMMLRSEHAISTELKFPPDLHEKLIEMENRIITRIRQLEQIFRKIYFLIQNDFIGTGDH